MGRAPAMREDMHIHFKQAAQCLPILESGLRKQSPVVVRMHLLKRTRGEHALGRAWVRHSARAVPGDVSKFFLLGIKNFLFAIKKFLAKPLFTFIISPIDPTLLIFSSNITFI